MDVASRDADSWFAKMRISALELRIRVGNMNVTD